MRWAALLMAAGAMLSLNTALAAPPVRDGIAVIETVNAWHHAPTPDVQQRGLDVVADRAFDAEVWIETDHNGAATFVSRYLLMRGQVDLPPSKWTAFADGTRKAHDWCRTIATENVSVEKTVGHYTAIGKSGKWEGLSLKVVGVRDSGCRVFLSGYQAGSVGLKIYVAPRDAIRLGSALAHIPRTARQLSLERARASTVREHLR